MIRIVGWGRERPFWVALGAVGLLVGIYLSSLHNYLLFHSLAELFSIVIAYAVFMLTWNARHLAGDGFLLSLGVASLFVGSLDTLHLLSYSGMGVYPGFGPDLPTQLWIAARYLQAGSLLVGPIYLKVRFRSIHALVGYGLITAALLASIFWLDLFPTCFVPGVGLTPFKIISEYVICVALVVSLGLLILRRDQLDPQVLGFLAASTVSLIGAELAFTFYHDVTGVANLIGHLLKIVAFYALYRAAIAISLMQPYRSLFRDLMRSRGELEEARDRLELRVAHRTAELSQANALLQREIEGHRAARERIEGQLGRLRALHAIDQSITSTLDLKLVLGEILDQLVAQLPVDAACFSLLDGDLQALSFSVGRGFAGSDIEGWRPMLGEGLHGERLMAGQPVTVPDLSLAPELVPARLLAGEALRSYIGLPLVAKARTIGLLSLFHREPLQPAGEWRRFAETLAGQAAIAVENVGLYADLQVANAQLAGAWEATLEGWALALDLRDRETKGHSQRVAALAVELAKELGIEGEALTHLRRGALLHDIGKMAVPDAILNKPGPLTATEWQIMRKHPGYARDMLWQIAHLRPALDIPYSHHEKWDGSGYPQGLAGHEIALSARIFAVVDAWDALRSDRPYQASLPEAEALERIVKGAGSHFDPEVVKAFLRLRSSGASPSVAAR